MNDWYRYMVECSDTDLWGFVCLDYYYRVEPAKPRADPSHFVSDILQRLRTAPVNPVPFHNVLLSVCVQLLGSDFDAITEKTLEFIALRSTPPTQEELEQIISHYVVYGQESVITEKINHRRQMKTDPRIDSGKLVTAPANILIPIHHPRKPVTLFYSYAHEDEKMRAKLEKHLAALKAAEIIAAWHDRKIPAGASFDTEINKHLREARIILLLISASFLSSDYCQSVEMKFALDQQRTGNVIVIPVILRECDWKSSPFAQLQALPKDGLPVSDSKWNNQDKAFTDVAKGIRAVAERRIATQAAVSANADR